MLFKKSFYFGLLILLFLGVQFYVHHLNQLIPQKHVFSKPEIAAIPKHLQKPSFQDIQRKPAANMDPRFRGDDHPYKRMHIVQERNGNRYLAQEVLMRFDKTYTKTDILRWADAYPIDLKSYDPQTGISRFEITQNNLSVKNLLYLIHEERNPNILFSEPNHVIELAQTYNSLPNDFDHRQWYIYNDGVPLPGTLTDADGTETSFELKKEKNADIANGKILEAWKLKDGGPVIVAVADTGVDIYHPEFSETEIKSGKLNVTQTNIWENPDEIPDNGLDDDKNGFIDDIYGWDFYSDDVDPSPDLDFEKWIEENVAPDKQEEMKAQVQAKKSELEKDATHGTHIAGVIAALSKNKKDTESNMTAITQHSVKVMALKMGGLAIIKVKDEETGEETKEEISYQLSPISDVVKTISYAKSKGAQIFNASWGTSSNSQTLKTAISDAKDMLFVTAAGNQGEDNDETPYFPSSYAFEHIFATAASDPENQMPSFSNTGKTSVDIAVPGKLIRSLKASARNIEDPNTFKLSEFIEMSGTSMSAGILSGVCALVFLEFLETEDSVTAGKIKFALIQTSKPVLAFKDKVVSNGVVNLYQALLNIRNGTLAEYTPPPPEEDFTSAQNANEKIEIQSVGGCGQISTPGHTPPPDVLGYLLPFFMLLVFLCFRNRRALQKLI